MRHSDRAFSQGREAKEAMTPPRIDAFKFFALDYLVEWCRNDQFFVAGCPKRTLAPFALNG
jgi:hypothetical protein